MALPFLLAAAILPAGTASPARADTPACATTTDPTTPANPSAGSPCWIDEPYPFGYDGNPVDLASPYCQLDGLALANRCYLVVDSMAFRAWNRGLAAVSPNNSAYPSPYRVWRYNGSRWYPDPTFPGVAAACPGGTILWAGKLDAWLVGDAQATSLGLQHWPTLCRFDGVTDQWEPLAVPAATVAAQPTGTITTGACPAWNNCWFFGTGGAVVHWDGVTLTNVSSGLGPSPWLTSNFTDASTATNALGDPVALAVSALNAGNPQPDGAAAPELFLSTGNQFSPLTFSPPAQGGVGGSPGTDLEAISFDAQGDGWVAGNPAAPPLDTSGVTFNRPLPSDYAGPAPLLPIATNGAARPCAALSADSFPYSGTAYSTSSNAVPSYLWSSIGVMPGGDAVAGGLVATQTKIRAGRTFTTSTASEPLLARVSCQALAQTAAFRIADSDPEGPPGLMIPADAGGYVTAVAANAVNDVWAATSSGGLLVANVAFGGADQVDEPPHLYRLSDGRSPDAPSGNDVEPRPVISTPQPTIFEFPPPVLDTTATTITTTSVTRRSTVVKRVRLKPALYDIQTPKVRSAAGGKYTLSISFRVRRKLKIGLEAIRHGKVVSSSGLRSFSGARGTLAVTLTRQAWPTGLKFILPKSKSS